MEGLKLINVYDKILIKSQKKREKNGNRKNILHIIINCHQKDGLMRMEFTLANIIKASRYQRKR